MPTRHRIGATLGGVALLFAVVGYVTVGAFAQGVLLSLFLALPLALAAHRMGAARLAVLAALTVAAEVVVLLAWSIAPTLPGELVPVVLGLLLLGAAAINLRSYLGARRAP